jgi:hypothetical protein
MVWTRVDLRFRVNSSLKHVKDVIKGKAGNVGEDMTCGEWQGMWGMAGHVENSMVCKKRYGV